MTSAVKLTECPRDAMQGITEFIPTEKKAAYINSLLRCGFDTLDFGSFVSPKAIPQMKDTAEVLSLLDLSDTKTKLLAITANLQGAEKAASFDEISFLGFPFSVSETFQKRNINSSISDSLQRVEEIQSLCLKKNKKLMLYVSMAFGNPYGDEWNAEMIEHWINKLAQLDIKHFALADTIGVSDPATITYLFSHLLPAFPALEFGAHLHSTPDTWREKIEAAVNSGCRNFDSALGGFGGCPMAKDDLTGNIATENLLSYFRQKAIPTGINEKKFSESALIAARIFH